MAIHRLELAGQQEGNICVLPPVVRDIAALVYRYKIKQQIYGHGMGRHKPEEVFELGMKDIDALSACLGDKEYFLGDQPTTLDASAFGFLSIPSAARSNRP